MCTQSGRRQWLFVPWHASACPTLNAVTPLHHTAVAKTLGSDNYLKTAVKYIQVPSSESWALQKRQKAHDNYVSCAIFYGMKGP